MGINDYLRRRNNYINKIFYYERDSKFNDRKEMGTFQIEVNGL